MKKAEQITRGILALFLIVGCYLFLAPSGRFSAQAVLSGSMEPAIKTGGLNLYRQKTEKTRAGRNVSHVPSQRFSGDAPGHKKGERPVCYQGRRK